MTTNYDRIRQMSVEEMAEFLQKYFDENEEMFGCYGCMDYGTHHHPTDCKDCEFLQCEGDIKKWLTQESKRDENQSTL